MCNYCYNSIRARGSEASIKKFYEILKDCYYSSRRSVFELLIAHNYKEEDLKEVDKRDYVCNFEQELSYDTNTKQFYFNFYTESAWGPNLGILFRLMKEKYAKEIELIYTSEEPGNTIYLTNDIDNSVWADKYYMEYCLGSEVGGEYFTTKQELINYIHSLFNVDASHDDSLEMLEGRILEKYKIKTQGTEYIYIHEFEYDNNMYAA